MMAASSYADLILLGGLFLALALVILAPRLVGRMLLLPARIVLSIIATLRRDRRPDRESDTPIRPTREPEADAVGLEYAACGSIDA